MHQIELFAFAKGAQEFLNRIKIRLNLKCGQCVQSKHGIVKITLAITILKATVGVLLICQEILDQFGSIPQHLGGQTGHLQHFKPEAHEETGLGLDRLRTALAHFFQFTNLLHLAAPALDHGVVEYLADDAAEEALEVGVFQVGKGADGLLLVGGQ